MARKYLLCFVDDDEHELKKFKAAFEGEFYVGIGTDLGKAEANLTENIRVVNSVFGGLGCTFMCSICTFQLEQPTLLNNELNWPRLWGTVAKQIAP